MKKFHWLAPCASILCLIHCIGFSIIGVLFPFFLTSIPHIPALDWSVVGINLVLGFFSLKTMQVNRKYFALFLVITIGAAASLWFHQEEVFHCAIFVNAIFHVGLLFSHHRKTKKHRDCCDHKQ